MNELLRIGVCTAPKNIISKEGKYQCIKVPYLVLTLLKEPYDLYFELPLEEIVDGDQKDLLEQSRLDLNGIDQLMHFLQECKIRMKNQNED